MARGKQAAIGDENKAANGYHYVRTASGWRLKHHLVAEEKYGRYVDTKTEQVVFINKNREDFRPSNIEIRPKAIGSDAKKRARIEARIQELQAELDNLGS